MSEELDVVRQGIDEVDRELVTLLKRRLQLVSKVGEIKSRLGIPVYAPDRERDMLEKRRSEAEKHGISPQLIEDVLRRIMRESYCSEHDAGFKCVNPSARNIVIIGGNGQLGRAINNLYKDRADIECINTDVGELDITNLEEVLKFNRDSIVIVDEAYVDFGAESAVSLINKYDNLIVTQTYSKSRNLAGLRIGMAFASAELIAKVKAVKFSINSYTMNEPSLRLASAVLKDEKYFRECCDKVIKTREWSEKEFEKLGFSFPESSANFVFVTHPKVNANDIYKALRERGILVRHFSIPRIDNYLRISIGTDEEMKALFEALREIVK